MNENQDITKDQHYHKIVTLLTLDVSLKLNSYAGSKGIKKLNLQITCYQP